MKTRILVVDDELSMRELLRHVLQMAGFEVLLAADDAEFRTIALNEKVDAIILDILLGDADGTQVYGQLIAEGLSSAIPVVFLSALAQDRPSAFPQRGRRYALLGKPFDPDELVARLHEFLPKENQATG
jgi:DNA-binding response OmpR family regulator